MKIVPAILATTEEEYKQKLQLIESSNLFDWIQIDLMDNKFVQNKSVGIEVLVKYHTPLKREAQLMVEYPENWIDELIKVGVNRIVFPVEDIANLTEVIDHIKNHDLEVGLSLNPETPVEKVEGFLDRIETVLVMSVHPGFGGQSFILHSLQKIRELAERKGTFLIGVDGGINQEVIKSVDTAGADYAVIGSHLLKGDINENLEHIQKSLKA